MKTILRALAFLAVSVRCFAADPVPLMLTTNHVIYGQQTGFFDANIALITNALASAGYNPGSGGGGGITNVAAADITDATATGIALITAATAADGRESLELGSASTNAASAFEPAGISSTDITDSTAAGRAMLTAADVPAQLSLLDLASLYAPILNPATSGTFTHNGTNIVATPTSLTFNVGRANALVINPSGYIGVGVASPSYDIQTAGTIRSGNALSVVGTVTIGSGADASGVTTASLYDAGGAYFTKNGSFGGLIIRSNAPPVAATIGKDSFNFHFATNQLNIVYSGPTSNLTTVANISTGGVWTLPALAVTGSLSSGTLYIDNIVATNPVDVASGGTGKTNLTSGALLVGSGSGTIELLGPTNSSIAGWDSGGNPTAYTAGSGITLTGGQISASGGGTNGGYVIPFMTSVATAPADGTTYYAGMWPGLTGGYTNASIRIPKTGTLKAMQLRVWCQTAVGSSEGVPFAIRYNDTSDFATQNLKLTNAVTQSITTGLSQSVVAGDFVALKIASPTWVTNPTGVYVVGNFFIE